MLYQTQSKGGVHIEYTESSLEYKGAIEPLLDKLNAERGALFASNFEFPGRYTCWDIGFCNPPLALVCQQQKAFLEAYNTRGEILLAIIKEALTASEHLIIKKQDVSRIDIEIKTSDRVFTEEERSRQPSIFTVLRAILDFFHCADEPYLGLYGAFGYDLIYQFEPMTFAKKREDCAREMVLYFPDELTIVNHRKEEAFIRRYEFQFQGKTTQSLPRDGSYSAYKASQKPNVFAENKAGTYAALVEKAKERFACGDLFEVVLSQTFFESCNEQPASLFRRLTKANPAPYGFLINLGSEEYLVGASPEMYVRLRGREVETCPISGTIKRGRNAIEDAEHIQILLDSEKEASELTMCTDVDRNDKSRICEPGSVEVIGRRQIEMYSRLIHTVDHVKGRLREGFDAVDAFLTHMWVVTVTGAPKLWAMQFIEKEEKSPRRWYAGAVGWFGFNGDLNTGLVLRTIRIEKGIAEVRVGATLLFDSKPEMEEEETHLKASALMNVLKSNTKQAQVEAAIVKNGANKRILLVDHQDSFVHTLANYLRQTGAEVITIRFDHAKDWLQQETFDLAVLSPGPGNPNDFHLKDTIDLCLKKKLPIFGVCLGLQGLVEYFGGTLAILPYPMHGKTSSIVAKKDSPLFVGLENPFKAARYHSLYAHKDSFPDVLSIEAESIDGVIMAIAHKKYPIYAVQFHPESILSLTQQTGIKIISNMLALI